MQALLKLFIKIWGVDTPLIADFKPDIIAPLSYAVKKNSLTNGTREILKTAIKYWQKFPSALLVFASSAHSFPSSDKVEEKFKLEILDQMGVPRESVLYCGPIVNTVTEAEAICRTLQKAGEHPKNILLVTGILHSRGAKYIWEKTLRKYFPGTILKIAVIHFEYEYQKDHPLFFQRGPLRWIFANIGRQLALRLLGLKFVRKIYEPSNLD